MARQISVIQQQILDQAAADPILAPNLNSLSKRAIYRLWSFICAVAIAVHEQLCDAFKVEVEAKIAAAAPGSPQWVRAQVMKFQYSDSATQVVQLIDLAPRYPVNDVSLRIITRCSVTTDVANNVTVKVAKGDPPEELEALQLDALKSYLDIMGVAGVTYNAISQAADRIYVRAQIYYTGLFSSVIKTNVYLAIDNYLAGIDFNGQVKVIDLKRAIMAVDGVDDVIIERMTARPNSKPFAEGTALVQSNALVGRYWPTVSGYAISEDTAGQTLVDSLTFVAL